MLNEYDSRVQWKDLISGVMTQKDCNACWAFSSALSFSDRLRIRCIKTGDSSIQPLIRKIDIGQGLTILNALDPLYMVQNKLSCTTEDQYICNMSCGGGYIDSAMKYLTIHGCQTLGESLLYKSRGYYRVNRHATPQSAGQIDQNVMDISVDIVNNGPVVAGFDVYKNFWDEEYDKYYDHTEGPLVLKHAVSIVGWKYHRPTSQSYWICRNSYGKDYMDRGYFYILRGYNFCGVESSVYGSIC